MKRSGQELQHGQTRPDRINWPVTAEIPLAKFVATEPILIEFDVEAQHSLGANETGMWLRRGMKNNGETLMHKVGPSRPIAPVSGDERIKRRIGMNVPGLGQPGRVFRERQT